MKVMLDNWISVSDPEYGRFDLTLALVRRIKYLGNGGMLITWANGDEEVFSSDALERELENSWQRAWVDAQRKEAAE